MEKYGHRVAIVTGAGQGIGKGVAKRFLQEGYVVVIAEKDEKMGRAAAAELSKLGTVVFIHTDVRSEKSIKNLMSAVIKRFGGLDVLINNAGAFHFKNKMQSLSLAEWNDVIETNLTGSFLCAKYAAPHLKKRKGAIVSMASTRALQSEPGKEAYAASKGGIVALTHALAIDLGPDVRVNCISPDWIDTGGEKITRAEEKQFPAGRLGRPDDVAAMILFLVHPENSFVTGSNVLLDGGMTHKMEYV